MRSDGRSRRRAGLIVAIGVLLTGCAPSGYNAGAIRGHLVHAGLTAKEADCVVLHMGPRFGDERLGARADPSASEYAAERALMQACGVNLRAR